MGIAALDTFHGRRGDQMLLDAYGQSPIAWGRLFGRTYSIEDTPTIEGLDFQLDPTFTGQMGGVQAGLDLLGIDHGDSSQDRFGLFYTHTKASGDMTGFTLAIEGNRSGVINLTSNSLGAYWNHVAPSGWYIDAVAMAGWLNGSANSLRGIGADISGTALLAGLEGGYPFALTDEWTVEPQAQIVWQGVNLSDTQDVFSTIGYSNLNTVTGRLGLRLEGDLTIKEAPMQPFLDVNLWHTFGTDNAVEFNDGAVTSNVGGTSLEFGAGLAAQLSADVSAFGSVRYITSLGGPQSRGVGANVGLRIKW